MLVYLSRGNKNCQNRGNRSSTCAMGCSPLVTGRAMERLQSILALLFSFLYYLHFYFSLQTSFLTLACDDETLEFFRLADRIGKHVRVLSSFSQSEKRGLCRSRDRVLSTFRNITKRSVNLTSQALRINSIHSPLFVAPSPLP